MAETETNVLFSNMHSSQNGNTVTSFSSISYCSTQKPTQSESIQSIILDVHVLKAKLERVKRLDKNFYIILLRHSRHLNKTF